LWFSSLAELGESPLGIADMNPGADDTKPHAVTSVGMVLTLVMLVVASVAAYVQYRRFVRRSRPPAAVHRATLQRCAGASAGE
jgi:hypothetical protein